MRHVVVVTKGHPFQREPFEAMLDALAAGDAPVTYEHVEHPDAQRRLHPDRLGADAVVFYDMPGITFTRAAPEEGPPALVEPPPAEVVEGIEALLAAGTGIVALHHALAGWPAWDRWAEIVGGRFHYLPAAFRGEPWPDSGYLLDVTHTVDVVAPEHPVCAGLPASFELHDELYLVPPIAPGVTPLLRTRFPMTAEHFHGTLNAISGRRDSREGWTHPDGPDLVGWAHTVERSRVVYLQPGDGPAAYADANVRRLLTNAIHWVADV